MLKSAIILTIFINLLLINSICSSHCPDINAIKDFDVQKYMGVWYEIMRLPARFENGKKCIQAEYKIVDENTISVNNSAFDIRSNKQTFRLGKGTIQDQNAKNKLIVEFKVGPYDFFTVKGKYNVIETDYSNYAIIYTCRNYYLFKIEYAWILSRKRILDNNITKSAIDQLKNYTNVENLLVTDQTNC